MESKKISVYVLALAMALGTVVPLTSSLASAATVTCDPSSLVQVQYGQNSSDVANAQACLVQAGYNIPAGPTGYYGSETEAAVISFYQSWYGAWNGLSIGPKGVAQLQSLVSGSSSNNASNNNATLSALLKGLGLNDQQIAAILAMLSSSSSTSTPTSTSATSTSATSTTPSGNVSVALSSNNQPAGSIIAGASQNPVLTVTVTNNTSQAVTVTGLTYTKTGVVSDSNITNAYLATGNNIVSQYQSLSNGVLNFSGNLVVIQAGQSQDLTLRVDVGTNANAGNTISFNLTGMTVDSGTLNVTYPYAGNTFTVTTVSNPSLASVSNFVYQGVANSVNAGTSNFRGSAMTMTVNTNPIKIMSVKYTVSGSVNFNSDLQNLVLKIDGNQVASASSTASDGTVLFNIPNGVVLGTGSHTFEVFLNVVGTPNRNFEFQILRPYDIIALDNQYNANISFGTPSGTLTPVNVQQGTVTMTLDSSSPTGNVAIGQSGVTLEKVDVTANGEAVRFLFLPVTITLNGTTTIINSSNIDNQIRNLAVYDSNGNQVGSTLSQLSAASSNCTFSTTGSTNQAICSLGSSSSNINYTIPANTTVVLTVKADIQSTLMNGITSIQASLPAPASNNLQGQISFQGSASQTINGSNLGVTSHPFTGGLNSAYSNQSFVGGISGAHIGSFALSAAAAEGINVSSLTFAVPSLSNVYLQNMKVLINGSQFGLTANTISTGNA
ncbi:peptidoglycan-binding protein, partial [Patescibacteria group bacterium]|nr:peptidoglycan-binding protein [Patescibacteria group bacterium]